jgi:hypothetical protein
MSRIAILCPKYAELDDATKDSLRTAYRELKDEFLIHTYTCTGTYIHHARWKLFKVLLNTMAYQPYEYVLWLDSDVAFKPSDIVRLRDFLVDNNEDIVSGLYMERRHLAPLGGPWDSELGMIKWVLDPKEMLKDTVYEIGWMGLGFCLCTTDLVKKYCSAYPATGWFEYWWLPLDNADGRWERVVAGEDITFSRKVTQLGYKMWLDTHVRLDHAGVTYEDFLDRENSCKIQCYAPCVMEDFSQ